LDGILAADVVERADVRVVQASDRARLALEAHAALAALLRLRRQDFDGHGAIDARVDAAIHLAHAAAANEGDDLVRAQTSARRERHGRRAVIITQKDTKGTKDTKAPGWRLR